MPSIFGLDPSKLLKVNLCQSLLFMRYICIIISPNEVFVDIMVLALPPRPLPVDPDDVNTLTKKIFNRSLSIIYEGRYPLRYVAIEI